MKSKVKCECLMCLMYMWPAWQPVLCWINLYFLFLTSFKCTFLSRKQLFFSSKAKKIWMYLVEILREIFYSTLPLIWHKSTWIHSQSNRTISLPHIDILLRVYPFRTNSKIFRHVNFIGFNFNVLGLFKRRVKLEFD